MALVIRPYSAGGPGECNPTTWCRVPANAASLRFFVVVSRAIFQSPEFHIVVRPRCRVNSNSPILAGITELTEKFNPDNPDGLPAGLVGEGNEGSIGPDVGKFVEIDIRDSSYNNYENVQASASEYLPIASVEHQLVPEVIGGPNGGTAFAVVVMAFDANAEEINWSL